MSTVRTAAVVLAAVSAFALSACGPSEDGAADTGSTTPSAGATASGTPSTPAAPPKAPSAVGTPPAPSAPSASAPASGPSASATDADYDVFPCSTYDVTFSAHLAEPTTSSYLLKITNKSGKACRALGHPVVTFGDLDGQATQRGEAPGIEDALRLGPGESAYAGLLGGAHDGTGKTVGSIALTMDTESDLEQKPLTASTPGLYASPTANSVTPWVDNAEDALSL
ncbi:DUF4232 domain-containing protein [Streptomyces longwoodensis]|uniref:DUF4232 domain-containing protein n=1 Tax=Streptomyces longwoodensis TaxID=68231 RepID=UPI0030DE06FE|nr:DUF4232 domain-containing protein [Streptomyces longwoodensis]